MQWNLEVPLHFQFCKMRLQKRIDTQVDRCLELRQQAILFFQISKQSIRQFDSLLRFVVQYQIGSSHLHVDVLSKQICSFGISMRLTFPRQRAFRRIEQPTIINRRSHRSRVIRIHRVSRNEDRGTFIGRSSLTHSKSMSTDRDRRTGLSGSLITKRRRPVSKMRSA